MRRVSIIAIPLESKSNIAIGSIQAILTANQLPRDLSFSCHTAVPSAIILEVDSEELVLVPRSWIFDGEGSETCLGALIGGIVGRDRDLVSSEGHR